MEIARKRNSNGTFFFVCNNLSNESLILRRSERVQLPATHMKCFIFFRHSGELGMVDRAAIRKSTRSNRPTSKAIVAPLSLNEMQSALTVRCAPHHHHHRDASWHWCCLAVPPLLFTLKGARSQHSTTQNTAHARFALNVAWIINCEKRNARTWCTCVWTWPPFERITQPISIHQHHLHDHHPHRCLCSSSANDGSVINVIIAQSSVRCRDVAHLARCGDNGSSDGCFRW